MNISYISHIIIENVKWSTGALATESERIV